MKNRYTVYGTREFDQKIDDDMHIIAEAVAGGISGNQIAAVILGGGYGRGEGGVHRNSKGEMSLHNDYDMFVITDNVSYSARQKINRELKEISEKLTARIGIDVDFSPVKNRSELATLPFTMMWQELKCGHKVIYGSEDILDDIAALDLNHMPAEEAAKLMLNRGVGLLLSRQKLEDGCPEEEDLHFVKRNIWKAVMACGDVFMIFRHNYSHSYVRRLEILETYRDDPLVGDFFELYRQSIEYKLRPDDLTENVDDLRCRFAAIKDIFKRFYIFTFACCCGKKLETMSEVQDALFYDDPFSAGESLIRKFKNLILNFKEVGFKALNIRFLFKYPRLRLFIVFPCLLFASEAKLNYIKLVVKEDGVVMDRFLQLWNRFN